MQATCSQELLSCRSTSSELPCNGNDIAECNGDTDCLNIKLLERELEKKLKEFVMIKTVSRL